MRRVSTHEGLLSVVERAGLRDWYLEALAGRIEQLRGLREGLAAGQSSALDAAKHVAQALRGSGTTFGFPELTAVAGLVEASSPADTYRRSEGLIEYLHHVRRSSGSPPSVRAEWLAYAAGARARESYADLAAAWADVAAKAGTSAHQLADRVAAAFGLRVADLSSPSRSALRLVPEVLMRSASLLPTGEDGETVTVACADPTRLAADLELMHLTGRRPVFTVAAPEDLAQAFVAVLEVAPVPVAPRRKATQPQDGAGQGTVLVVDDDPGDRLLARRVLEKSGYAVLDAGDGREALERLAGDPSVALVVADLNMPVLDGLELIWEMRDADRWSHIPVIVLTGETDELLEAKLLEEGADDYLSKPFDPRRFLARVEATIRRAAEERQAATA